MKTILLNSIKEVILILLIVMLLLSCCSKIFPDEKLTLIKQDYLGKELRIDGCYLNYAFSKDSQKYYDIYFLYENGIIIYFATTSEVNINNLSVYIKQFEDTVKNFKYNYGLFIIENSILKIERWYPANAGQGLPVYIKEGKILNDTTFHITVSYKPDGSEKREKDEIYHFKQFSPKPDSTNVFIP